MSRGVGGVERLTGTEHGDRERFLAPARGLLADGIRPNPVHVPPAAPLPSDPVPEARYLNLDPGDLVTSFADAVAHAEGVCHVVEDDVPDGLLDRIVAELGRRDGPSVVVSPEPEARAVGDRLAARGLAVAPATPATAADAALGVTSAAAAIAATGSVVLDSRRAGGRVASLLPSVHLCVMPVDRLVATPADVLRRLGPGADAPPPSLVVVTGPSRTGDIEQLLTLGAHGPTALHVVLVTGGQGASQPSGPAAG
jgi:L-lactate dehydrogenase complex protein LldG